MRHGKGISRNKPSTYQRVNRVVRAAVKDDQYVCACATIWMREAGCVTSFSLIGDITRRMRFEKWRRGKPYRNNGPLSSGLLFGAPRWPLLSVTRIVLPRYREQWVWRCLAQFNGTISRYSICACVRSATGPACFIHSSASYASIVLIQLLDIVFCCKKDECSISSDVN